jgi:nucleoid DNA-binding protein
LTVNFFLTFFILITSIDRMHQQSLSQLVRELSNKTGIPQYQVKSLVQSFVLHIGENLSSGREVILGNLGKFTLRYRAERHRKTPQVVTSSFATKALKTEVIIPAKVIPAKAILKFLPSPRLSKMMKKIDLSTLRREKRNRNSAFATSNPPLPVVDSASPNPPPTS